MFKRITCLLLGLCLLLSLALPVLAKEDAGWRAVRIRSERDFQTLAESCRLDSYSRNLKVYLDADLDLSGRQWESIPIFCGIFQGNGHRITGLAITSDGSYQGLFRYLAEGAQVLDLKLEGDIAPGGSQSYVGAIAGENRGLIKNCSFTGSVSGSSHVGGLVGENCLSGSIEDCRVQGSVQGTHFVGGVAGTNGGDIQRSVSHARVNTTSQENTVALTDISLDSIMTSESASTVTDIGGIAGVSTGLIRSCVNHGDVGYQHMGYNVGGIAGTQSGFVDSSINHGHIRGRKEVGGIVGQMEPSAVIDFDEDALQILRRQLAGMGSTVNQTAANVQDTGDALSGQVAALGDHVVDAKDAVELLLPKKKGDKLEPPSQKNIEKAKAHLGSSISGMNKVLSGMSATTMSAVGRLSNNLHALQSQMNAMSATLDNVSETLGGSIRDMSDLDTPEDITGKVRSCRNFGDVLADMNAGGITGAIAMENDLDPEEDFAVVGTSSLNFESQLRAVVLSCENEGTVTAGKRALGGIAGWQSLGLVKDCRSIGSLEGEGVQYVGGISGQSLGFIRSCAAKCILTGGEYLGGIAGTASVVTDCMAMPSLHGATERRGAILGGTEEGRSETEAPTGNNFYLRLNADAGGIDGVSYDTVAQSMDARTFFAAPGVPGSFREAKVRFVYEDGKVETFRLEAGSSLARDRIPELPELADSQSAWEGLEEADLEKIFFDLTFREKRHKLRTVLESTARTEEDLPLILAQGIFPDSAVLEAEDSALSPGLREGDTLLGAWVISMSHPADTHTLHLRLPRDCDPERLTLQVHTGSGWQSQDFTLDGSYLLFPMSRGLDAAALTQEPPYPWQYPAMIAGGAVLVMLVLFLIRRKKK